jgi:DNA invertase Pin-like site-specific DNA recombinase
MTSKKATKAPVTYGYARVSTADQNLSRQFDALAGFGIPEALVFSDKASGKDFERPEWRRLVRRLQPEDMLVVKSIDRLGRNYEEIIEQWRLITKERHAHIVVLDMPLLDTREKPDNITGTFIADLVLQLLSYVAQVERESIRARQAEGIAAAQARGVHCGRPAVKRPSSYGATKKSFETGLITRKEAAAMLGVSTTTFDKWRAEDRSEG